MTPLPRMLLNAATAVSLVLCVLAVGFWARTAGAPDEVRFGKAGGSLWLFNTRPGVVACTRVTSYTRDTPRQWTRTDGLHVPIPPRGRGPGVEIQRFDRDPLLLWTPASYRDWAVAAFERGTCAHVRFVGRVPWLTLAPLSPPLQYTSVVVPLWFLAALAAALPTARFAHFVVATVRKSAAHPRRDASLCPACGYDLRATPGRCPECGTVPARPSA